MTPKTEIRPNIHIGCRGNNNNNETKMIECQTCFRTFYTQAQFGQHSRICRGGQNSSNITKRKFINIKFQNKYKYCYLEKQSKNQLEIKSRFLINILFDHIDDDINGNNNNNDWKKIAKRNCLHDNGIKQLLKEHNLSIVHFTVRHRKESGLIVANFIMRSVKQTSENIHSAKLLIEKAIDLVKSILPNYITMQMHLCKINKCKELVIRDTEGYCSRHRAQKYHRKSMANNNNNTNIQQLPAKSNSIKMSSPATTNNNKQKKPTNRNNKKRPLSKVIEKISSKTTKKSDGNSSNNISENGPSNKRLKLHHLLPAHIKQPSTVSSSQSIPSQSIPSPAVPSSVLCQAVPPAISSQYLSSSIPSMPSTPTIPTIHDDNNRDNNLNITKPKFAKSTNFENIKSIDNIQQDMNRQQDMNIQQDMNRQQDMNMQQDVAITNNNINSISSSCSVTSMSSCSYSSFSFNDFDYILNDNFSINDGIINDDYFEINKFNKFTNYDLNNSIIYLSKDILFTFFMTNSFIFQTPYNLYNVSIKQSLLRQNGMNLISINYSTDIPNPKQVLLKNDYLMTFGLKKDIESYFSLFTNSTINLNSILISNENSIRFKQFINELIKYYIIYVPVPSYLIGTTLSQIPLFEYGINVISINLNIQHPLKMLNTPFKQNDLLLCCFNRADDKQTQLFNAFDSMQQKR